MHSREISVKKLLHLACQRHTKQPLERLPENPNIWTLLKTSESSSEWSETYREENKSQSPSQILAQNICSFFSVWHFVMPFCHFTCGQKGVHRLTFNKTSKRTKRHRRRKWTTKKHRTNFDRPARGCIWSIRPCLSPRVLQHDSKLARQGQTLPQILEVNFLSSEKRKTDKAEFFDQKPIDKFIQKRKQIQFFGAQNKLRCAIKTAEKAHFPCAMSCRLWH